MPTLRSLCCPKDLGKPKGEIGLEFRATRQISEKWALVGGKTLSGEEEKSQEGFLRERSVGMM